VDLPARLWHLEAVLIWLLDAVVFSSLWLAAAAAVLVAAASRALGAPVDPASAALAACGTLVVYNVDRLRDIRRDHVTAPERTSFVQTHRRALVALTVLAGVASAALAPRLGRGAALLLAVVLAVGLLHRRLKRAAFIKPLYVTAAWLAVVVGLPWYTASQPLHTGWVLASLGCALLANAIASNLRDDEAGAARIDHALRIARGASLVGSVAALSGPPEVRALSAVPLATLAVLLRFHPSERFGLVALDGALLAGAVLALAL
jgi:hypothetical protein